MLRLALPVGLLVALVACGGKVESNGIIVGGVAYGAVVTVWSSDGRQQSVTAGDDGSFRVEGIRQPYDILFDYGATKSLVLGSTAFRHDVARPPPSQGLSTVSFGVTPPPALDATTLWVVDCGDQVVGSHSGDVTGYERGFYYDEPRSCDATVLVLNAGSLGYGGQGHVALDVLPATHTHVGVDVSQGVVSRPLAFEVTDPNTDTAYAATGLVLPARERGYAAHVLHEGAFASTTLAAPENAGLGLSVIFAAASSGDTSQGSVAWRALALDTDQDVRDVTLPSTDIILEPAAGAHLGERFALRPRDGSVYVFTVGDVSVTTASPELTVADLAAHGISLPSGAHMFRGYVTTATSVDDDLSLDGIIRQRDAVRIQSHASTFVID